MYGLYSYHWTNGTTGLAYLGAGVGSLLGIIITAKFMNKSFTSALARQEKRTGSSSPTPELRLPFMQIGMTIVPVGLIMFAWSAGRTHWIVPLLGACLFGAGMLMGYVCIHTYLVDCFGTWAASALAAAVVTRCIITCVFCIVGFELYRKLGYDWLVLFPSSIFDVAANIAQGINAASIDLHCDGTNPICFEEIWPCPAGELGQSVNQRPLECGSGEDGPR